MGTRNPCRHSFVFSALVVCLIFLNGLNAASGECKVGCPTSDSGKFRYAPGNVYNYYFDSAVTVAITGTDGEETNLKVTGQAYVYPQGNCAYLLKLANLKIDAGGKSHSADDFSKPVQFTLTSGELESQICSDPTDTDYSLNVKRAIISLFQSSEKSHETDIFGVCPTTFSTTQAGDSEIVTKIRNLNACGYREVISNGLIAGVINDKSGIKSTPLLNADYSMEQRIRNGIIENVQLIEEYKFVPFSNTNGGAKARVVTRLVFKGNQQSRGAPQLGGGGHSDTIIFKNPRPIPKSNENDLTVALQKTLSQFRDKKVSSDSAKHFTDVIRLMRYTTRDDFLNVLRKIKSGTVDPRKDLSRKVFLDSLFRAGTGNAVEVIATLISSNELSEKEKELAFLSFNLVESMTREALNAINQLLDRETSNNVYLSVGNLVNKYCKQESCEDNDVRAISEKFVSKLGSCRPNTKKHEDTIVSILKGIRNTYNFGSSAVNYLVQCTMADKPARVRVAALQAFTAAACNPAIQGHALNVFKDRNEDSEIRIEAYLAAVSCPNANVANTIADVINSEPVYQVGSFVSTHLKSIRDSTDPYRESARHHFNNIRVTKRFPFDARRYSFNQEVSYALESLGLGASADYSLIYSQNGFLPRSARMNLTGEVFGNNFNAFEFTARQENLEFILEKYFGPKGLFSGEGGDALFSIFAQHLAQFVGDSEGNGRQKRGTKEDVATFVHNLRQSKNEVNNDFSLDYSLKMFGNELYFLSFSDDFPTEKFVEAIKKETTERSTFQHNCEFQSIFLDAELVYPTGIGYPLELIAEGTGVGSIDVSAQYDLKQIVQDYKKTDVAFKLIPSSNIDVSGILKFDANVISTGIKVTMSLHSATGADVTFRYVDDATGFDLDIKLPFNKQEIVKLEHSISFVTEERGLITAETEYNPITVTDHCFDQLEKMIGMEVCGSFPSIAEEEKPRAPFPLAGSGWVALRLQTERHFLINGKSGSHAGYTFWELHFDTPRSQEPRKTLARFEFGRNPDIYASALFKHPSKYYAAEAGLINNENEFVIYGNWEDDNDKSVAKLGFQRTAGGGSRTEYQPIVYTSHKGETKNDIKGYSADGKVITEESGGQTKYNFQQLRLMNVESNKPIVFNGFVQIVKEPAELSTDMNIRVDDQDHNVKGKIAYTKEHISTEATITHSANPDVNSHYSISVFRGEDVIGLDLELAFGRDLSKKFKMHHKYHYQEDNNQLTYLKFDNVIEAERLNGKLKLNGEWSQQLLGYDFEIGFGEKKLGNSLKLAHGQNAKEDYDAEFVILLNRHRATASATRRIENNKSILDHRFDSSWGTRATLQGEIAHKFSAQDAFVDLRGTFQLKQQEQPLSWTLDFKGAPKSTNSNFKLARGQDELFVYHVVVNRGDTLNGKFDATLKDILVTKGDFKAGGGVGEATAIVNLKKLSKKIKLVSKFNIAAPTYDVDTTLFYDFEKDNDKKLTFVTKNTLDTKSFSTENSFDVADEKYSFNANGDYTGTMIEGVVNGKFSLKLPTGREISGDLHRNLEQRNNIGNGNAAIHLFDRLPTKQRSLEINSQISNFDHKAKFFDVQHHVVYHDFENRDRDITLFVKHQPKGHFKMAELSLQVKGHDVIPLEFHLNLDEFCEEHAVYRVTLKQGNKLDGNINGNYYVGGRSKPTTYDVQMNLNAPETEARTYTFQSSGKLVQPEVEGGIYEGYVKVYESAGASSVKVELNGKGNDNHGSYNVALELPNYDPIKIDGSYTQEENDKTSKYHGTTRYDYGNGKVIKTAYDLATVENKDISLHYTLQTPYEDARNVDLTFKATKSNTDTMTTSSNLVYNDKSYGLNTEFTLSDAQTVADITAVFPEKTVKFYSGFEKLGERKAKGKLHLENFGDFTFLGTSEVSFQSYDNFYLKVDIDSAKLNLNQVHIEANSQPNSNGKGVEFQASTAGKNILSGNAEYTVKTEKGKAIVEGQGNIRFYDKPRNANFKLIRQTYDLGHDGEAGFSYVFNGLFGPKNIVSELKVTNQNFNVKLASCEEKKQCTNFEIRSVVTVDKNSIDNVQHVLMVLIDLRELGYPHEFELQSKTSREGFKLEHELQMIISSNNNKYQLSAYFKPTEGGVNIKLPRREISLEGVYRVPNEIFGHYDTSLVLYMDKQNRPQDKAQVSFNGDVNRIENEAVNARGEFKFAHPTIRPLTVTGSMDVNSQRRLSRSYLEFDIFESPSHKIIASMEFNELTKSDKGANITTVASIKSEGLQFEYSYHGHFAVLPETREISYASGIVSATTDLKLGSYFYASPDKFEILITGFNEEILNANGYYDSQRNTARVTSSFKILGASPIELTAQMNGVQSASFDLKRKDNVFNVHGTFESAKEASIKVEGNSRELFNGRIALDTANFLTTQYDVHDNEVEEFMKSAEVIIKQDIDRAVELTKERFHKMDEIMQDYNARMAHALPDFSRLYSNYRENLDAVFEELASDPAIQNIINFYRNIYNAVSSTLSGIISAVSEAFSKFYDVVKEFYKNTSTLFSEKILPTLKAGLQSVTETLGHFYIESVKILSVAFERTVKVLKVFEADFNKMGKAFSDLFKNIAQELTVFFKNLKHELNELWESFTHHLQSLPGLQEIKDRLSKLGTDWPGAEQLKNFFDEVLTAVKEFMPTEDSKRFIDELLAFINRKLDNRPGDDVEELKSIYLSFFNAIRSLIMRVRAYEASPSSLLLPLPISWDTIKQFPVWTSFKFSPFNYLKNEKFDFLKNLFTREQPFGLLPPFELHGHIADGQHLFTFDGRHLTFPGSCSYLLAHDSLHHNFSLVAHLENGKMKSLTLMDKENSIEVDNTGNIKLNDRPTDFPVHHSNVHAWRRYYTVSLLTEYGARVMCSIDLRVCHVTVSGFYTGRTRGLLGKGNYEPYDDYTLPSGQITENFAEFGNSYGVHSCPPVPYVDHAQHQHHPKDPLCKEFFNIDSSLGLGFFFFETANYEEACQHATATSSDKEDAACNIALTFASAARLYKIPVDVPAKCLKCNPNMPDQRKIGDEFDVKTPQEKADVVLVVDTSLGNLLKELVQPLINDLRFHLKRLNMGDSRIAVIGYDANLKYPTLYTYQGSLDYAGKFGEIIIDGPSYPQFQPTGNENVDNFFKKYMTLVQLGRYESLLSSDAQAFNLAMDFPFRPNANKAIIAIRSDSLEYTNVVKVFGAGISNELAKKNGIALHLIGPVKDLTVDDKENTAVVGFSANQVVVRKNLKGVSINRNSLRFTNDMGTTLVQNDGGFVFPLQNFESQAQADKKPFIGTVAFTLADQLSRTEVFSDCKCKLVYGLHAEESCTARQVNMLPPVKKAAAGGATNRG